MLVNPAELRFTQDSISLYFQAPYDHFSVREAVRRISQNMMRPNHFPLIRVMSYEGHLWSVDNRRLWVFRMARCSSVDVQLVTKIHTRLKDLISNPVMYYKMQGKDFFPRVRDKGGKDPDFDRLFPKPGLSLQRPLYEVPKTPPINLAQDDKKTHQHSVQINFEKIGSTTPARPVDDNVAELRIIDIKKSGTTSPPKLPIGTQKSWTADLVRNQSNEPPVRDCRMEEHQQYSVQTLSGKVGSTTPTGPLIDQVADLQIDIQKSGTTSPSRLPIGTKKSWAADLIRNQSNELQVQDHRMEEQQHSVRIHSGKIGSTCTSATALIDQVAELSHIIDIEKSGTTSSPKPSVGRIMNDCVKHGYQSETAHTWSIRSAAWQIVVSIGRNIANFPRNTYSVVREVFGTFGNRMRNAVGNLFWV